MTREFPDLEPIFSQSVTGCPTLEELEGAVEELCWPSFDFRWSLACGQISSTCFGDVVRLSGFKCVVEQLLLPAV